MKFGSHLKEAISPNWQPYYLDYDLLKRKLGKAEKKQAFTERDETEFVEMLDSNLEKVYAFHKATLNKIRQEIDSCATAASNGQNSIKDKINGLADDINRLEKYSRFNYTGFLKIIKKHDRHTNYILRPMFMVRLNQCPFWKENEDLDALLIKVSELFSKVRGGTVQASTSLKATSQFAFDTRRRVIKRFFVHTDDIFELKTYVLRHLPVLVYRNNDKLNNQQDIDPPISTLYLDNADMDTYCSRVESAPHSQIIRLRWYGSVEGNKSISFERRTLNDENQGDIKDNFTIKDKYVDGFLHGDDTFLENSIKKIKASSRSSEDIQAYSSLVKGIQQQIMNKHMEPVLRTYYKRTAFQIPGDSSVRMALDTDLCFIREDSDLFPNDVKRRPDDCWRRPDADINFPFSNLKATDVNRYPYATFEIKLDLAPNESEPKWVRDLQESGLLEEAYQFSKFVHGMAIMFDTRVPLLPYWLAQIDDDRKLLPVLPSQLPSASKPTLVKRDERTSLLKDIKPSYASIVKGSTSEQGTSEQGTSEQDASEQGTSQQVTSAQGILEQDTSQQGTSQQSTSQQGILEAEGFILPPGVKIPKKVTKLIKVEPKVFFANERTYFSWMRFGTMLATFSLALFNSGDAVGKICGIMYTLIAISTLIYGVGLYYRRRELIRARLAGPYDEMIGPTIICFALMFAVGMNAYLRFSISTPLVLYLY